MKKKSVLVFILGVVCGIIVTFVTCYCITIKLEGNAPQTPPGITLFKEGEHGDVFYAKQLKLMQVLVPNVALAHTGNDVFGTLVLYVGNENDHFYDDQIIKVPNGKKIVQIGTYQYETTQERLKTVPVVRIK